MDFKQCFSWFQLAILGLTVLINQSFCSTIPQIGEPIIGLRITQGRDVHSHSKFPSQVSLQSINGKHVCGGSILNSAFVITAAHCFAAGTAPNMIRVVTGTVDLSTPGRAYGVSRIIIHPYFSKTFSPANGERNVNDIALLKVEPKFAMIGSEDSIKFPPPNRLLSGQAHVVGWGELSNGMKSTTLQEAMVTIISDQECDDHFGGKGSILPDTQVCAVGFGAGACRGDSGGPLFLASTGEQVGIVSFGGLPCGYGPTVFTQLSAYRDWVQANIHESRLRYFDSNSDSSAADNDNSLSQNKDSSIATNDDKIVFL